MVQRGLGIASALRAHVPRSGRNTYSFVRTGRAASSISAFHRSRCLVTTMERHNIVTVSFCIVCAPCGANDSENCQSNRGADQRPHRFNICLHNQRSFISTRREVLATIVPLNDLVNTSLLPKLLPASVRREVLIGCERIRVAGETELVNAIDMSGRISMVSAMQGRA